MKLLQKTPVWTSILYLLMGLALLFWPGALLRAAGYAVGAVILLLGVGAVRLYFRSRDMLFFSGFSLAAGLLIVGLGIFLLLQPDTFASLFPFVAGFFVGLDGLARLRAAFVLRRAGADRWWALAVPGVLSLAAGLLVLLHPFGMAVLTTRFIGGILAAESLLNLVCGLYAEWKMQRLWRESRQPEDEMLIQMRRLEEKFSRNRDSGPFSL